MKQILTAVIAIVTILVIATLIAIHSVFSDKKKEKKGESDIIRGSDYDIDKIFANQQHIHMS